jgi:hypothetical protein
MRIVVAWLVLLGTTASSETIRKPTYSYLLPSTPLEQKNTPSSNQYSGFTFLEDKGDSRSSQKNQGSLDFNQGRPRFDQDDESLFVFKNTQGLEKNEQDRQRILNEKFDFSAGGRSETRQQNENLPELQLIKQKRPGYGLQEVVTQVEEGDCIPRAVTETSTQYITNTMPFVAVTWHSTYVSTTSYIVDTSYVTATNTKTIDNELSITHSVTFYTTLTSTNYRTEVIPAKVFLETHTTTSTFIDVKHLTNIVTNTHHIKETDYVTVSTTETSVAVSFVPLTETQFVTLPPSTSYIILTSEMFETRTIPVEPFTTVETVIQVSTSTRVVDRYLPSQTSTIWKTIMIPDYIYHEATEYITSTTTVLDTNLIYDTSTSTATKTVTYTQSSTDIHVQATTVTSSRQLLVTSTVYDVQTQIVSEFVPSFYSATQTNYVTDTLTRTVEVLSRITNTVPLVETVYSTVQGILPQITRVVTTSITQPCLASVDSGYSYPEPENPFQLIAVP